MIAELTKGQEEQLKIVHARYIKKLQAKRAGLLPRKAEAPAVTKMPEFTLLARSAEARKKFEAALDRASPAARPRE